jgi:3-methylcrotonyl-CoA carboxylase alpha subunit
MTRFERSYELAGQSARVVVESDGALLQVHVGERRFAVEAKSGENGRLDLVIDGRRLQCHALVEREGVALALDGRRFDVRRPDPRRQTGRGENAGGAGQLRAAMPGRVIAVNGSPGDAVKAGDTIVLLEAMKMELRLVAPFDGVIARLGCSAGQVVERGQLLVEVTA